MKLTFRLSLSQPFSLSFSLFVLMESGEQLFFFFFEKPKKVISEILPGGPNVYPAARVASCWVRPWQRLMGFGFSTLESGLRALHSDRTRTMKLQQSFSVKRRKNERHTAVPDL